MVGRLIPLAVVLILMSGCPIKKPTVSHKAPDVEKEAQDPGLQLTAAERADLKDPRLGVGLKACRKKEAGLIDDKKLEEISGIDASLTRAGTYYVHNDSGDGPRIYLIDSAGRLLDRIKVKGAKAIDWEDMGTGPCGRETCIYVADFGNNVGGRAIFEIYAIPEGKKRAQTIRFQYPNKARYNAEALAVHPGTGEIFVIRKTQTSQNTLYRLPKAKGQVVTLQPVCDLHTIGAQRVTAADIHHSGKRLLVRTYTQIFEFEASQIADPAICRHQVRHLSHLESQGEAIAYMAGRDSFVTASEKRGQPFYHFDCE